MGLKDYKTYKKRQELLELLSSFGITEEDLKYLPSALKIVKEGNINKPVEITDEQKKKIKDKLDKTLTPEQMIQAFAGETEEFYPNGRS